MTKSYCLFLSLFVLCSGFAQIEKNLEQSYRSYFDLPRETMFIHTNKTTFLTGENIWFKTYTYDKLNQLPSLETKNIYVGLYDSIGNQISKKLYLANLGSTAGAFEIDSTFVSGTYYLKATTRWMQNFKEDDSFIQKIQVINPRKVSTPILAINSKEFDIQFLPEGGHIVSNIRNSVGVKVLDDMGKGTTAKGYILNSKGEQVSNFKTNVLGIGKFNFFNKADQIYTAKIILSNTKEVTIPMPVAQKQGITITVDNFRKDKTIATLKTNIETLENIKGKSFTLLLHQNGASSTIPFQFDTTSQSIFIPKEKLFQGINTITLFDQKNNPILERMFFHQKNTQPKKFAISQNQREGDSISYQLSTNFNTKELLDLSISVLPKQTKSYNPKHNIVSAIYLKPYLKGDIESPQYYFNKPGDRKRQYDLDNLLITQGWSRYNWDDIFYDVPKIKHPFENGIKLSGKLNQKLKGIQTLMLFPTNLNKMKYLDVYENGDFFLDNFYPELGEKLKFTTLKKSGMAKRPKIYVRIPNTIQKDKIEVGTSKSLTSFYYNKNDVLPYNFFKERVEQLDEIVLEARLNRVFKKRGPKFDGSIIKIDDEKAKTYNTIADILETEKFIVQRGTGGQQTRCSRGECSDNLEASSPDLMIISREKNSAGAPRPVFFYVDGVQVQNMNHFLMTGTLEYEDVYIDYSSNIVQNPLNSNIPSSEAIIVNLFSRITSFKSADLNNYRYSPVDVKYGFEPKKEFYIPGYVSYQIQPFKDYGVIHWEPNAVITSNSSFNFKTIDTNLKEVSFFIEGVGADGKLYSQVINLEKH